MIDITEYAKLLDYGVQLTNNQDKAKEILDELLAVTEKRQFDGPVDRKAFLYTSYRNYCYDYLRLLDGR